MMSLAEELLTKKGLSLKDLQVRNLQAKLVLVGTVSLVVQKKASANAARW
jgi:hypothetical protein